jgi:hypothetical protein
LKYTQKDELVRRGQRVIYQLPAADALGLADYSQKDKIREAETDRKFRRAFKKAFGVSATKQKQNAPSKTLRLG